MDKERVARRVREVAQGLRGPGGGREYIADPMEVYITIQRDHPDVYDYVRRYYRGDVYQTLKRWIPRP